MTGRPSLAGPALVALSGRLRSLAATKHPMRHGAGVRRADTRVEGPSAHGESTNDSEYRPITWILRCPSKSSLIAPRRYSASGFRRLWSSSCSGRPRPLLGRRLRTRLPADRHGVGKAAPRGPAADLGLPDDAGAAALALEGEAEELVGGRTEHVRQGGSRRPWSCACGASMAQDSHDGLVGSAGEVDGSCERP